MPGLRLKYSWLKNGLVGEGVVLGQDWAGAGGMETDYKYQRPRKALQHPNLLSGLVKANSRAGGEVVLNDVIPQLGKFPGCNDKFYHLLIPSPCHTPSGLYF